MKKKTFNRVFAMFSAVLYKLSRNVPFCSSNCHCGRPLEVKEQQSQKAYVMDAADLKAEQFGEDGKLAATTGDIKVGTDDYFTVGATGSKKLIKSSSQMVDAVAKWVIIHRHLTRWWI